MRNEDQVVRLAVLIDADNAQAAVIEDILFEIAKFGEATVKRIYGDFTTTNSSSWKKVLQKFAIKPVQQFAYTTGKNATDSAMIIDGMDLLYTRRFDGFCIISSDSDFTGLAMRIKEEGLSVYGFGEKKTPESFRNACHKFINIEIFRKEIVNNQLECKPATQTIEQDANSKKIDTNVANDKKIPTATLVQKTENTKKHNKDSQDAFLIKAAEQASGEDGWAQIGTLGSYLAKIKPDFDVREFGFKKLSDFIASKTNIFDIKKRALKNSERQELYIKVKSNKSIGQSQVLNPDNSQMNINTLGIFSEQDKALFIQAAQQAKGEDGWAYITHFYSNLRKLKESFFYKDYGFNSFKAFVKSLADIFDFEERQNATSSGKDIYLRPK